MKAKVIFKKVSYYGSKEMIYISGLLCNIVFEDNQKANTDGVILSNDKEIFIPDLEYEVDISLLRPEIAEPYLDKNSKFIGRDGNKVLLIGQVIS